MDTNSTYKKKELVSFIIDSLRVESKDNSSWEDLPNCVGSYKCLYKLNKTILIKIYECLMQL